MAFTQHSVKCQWRLSVKCQVSKWSQENTTCQVSRRETNLLLAGFDHPKAKSLTLPSYVAFSRAQALADIYLATQLPQIWTPTTSKTSNSQKRSQDSSYWNWTPTFFYWYNIVHMFLSLISVRLGAGAPEGAGLKRWIYLHLNSIFCVVISLHTSCIFAIHGTL